MLSFNFESLGRVAKALIAGDENVIGSLIENKLEKMGEDLIMQMIGSQLGAAQRIGRAIATGGSSEFEALRNDWLNQFKPRPLPGAGFLKKFQNQVVHAQRISTRPSSGHWRWDRSRQAWLNQDWRHNWRSQPRDWHGRWMPGRLKHPYISKTTRRARRKRRAVARKLAKQIFNNP